MDLIRDFGYLALATRLRRLADRLQASVAEVYESKAVGFRPRWFPLLAALARESPQPVTQLAIRLGLTHTAIAQIGAEMEAAGLVGSESDLQDGRRRLFTLTEPGRRMVEQLRPLWSDIEKVTAEVVAESGHDLLAAITGVEGRLDARAVPDRLWARLATNRSSMIRIVDWDPALASAFRSLNLEWIERYFEVEPADRELLDNPALSIVARGGEILFALADGEPVGTCALLAAGEAMELAKMAVTPRWQGRGIGRRLGEAAIERARSRGFRTLFLLSHPKLEAALALYHALGFVEAAQAPAPHGRYTRCSLTLERSLTRDPAPLPADKEICS